MSNVQSMYDLLDAQPNGTFLICLGQEVLMKNYGLWWIHRNGAPGYSEEILPRTIVTVIGRHRTWSLS